MAYKDDLCESSISVKSRPTRHRARDYALGVSGLETEEDKQIRRLYEESVFGPRSSSANLIKVDCPEITPLGDSTVNSLISAEEKNFVPPPASFSTSDLRTALTSSSDERENHSPHVWFDSQSQGGATRQRRRKIPPPIAPKPELPPGELNGNPEMSGARPKTRVRPPGSIYLPNKEDLAKDLYADGTEELRRYTVRICDICRMEYLACLYKRGNLDKRPFGSKGRICDECVEEYPDKSSAITVERGRTPWQRVSDSSSTQAPKKTSRQFQFRRDQYAPSTCASDTAACGLIPALPHATKVRKCDFCHREYVAIIGGVSIEEERPGSPSRVCSCCKYRPPERLPGCAVQTREGWFERRYDGPQRPQERRAQTLYSTKAEVKFFEPNLAKIPPVYDSNRFALMKLDTRMGKVNIKAADLFCD